MNSYNVIDLFCGAGGLSCGFERAGFNIMLGIDNDKKALETFEANHNDAKSICGDITSIGYADIKNVIGDDYMLEIKNICVREKVLHLTVDGKATFDLFFGDTVVITKASISTKLLRIKDEDFYSKIRMKKFI